MGYKWVYFSPETQTYLTEEELESFIVTNSGSIIREVYAPEEVLTTSGLKEPVSKSFLRDGSGTLHELMIDREKLALSLDGVQPLPPVPGSTSIHYTFADAARNTSSSYKIQGALPFKGSSLVGSPVAIKAIVKATSSSGGQVRLYDYSNKKVIAESEITKDKRLHIIELKGIDNIPETESIIEVQMRRLQCYSISLDFWE